MGATLRRTVAGMLAAGAVWAGPGVGDPGGRDAVAAEPVTPPKVAPVKPLKGEDCDKVRSALERRVPFAPGFRRLRFEFPKNDRGVTGHVCRLLTLGTGVHMEGPGITSLKDMRTLILAALTAAGWRPTPEAAKFTETSIHGRDVFALAKGGAICVSTIVVGMVEGAEPPPQASDSKKRIKVGQLKPYEREWWISVDCFGDTAPPPAPTAAGAAPAGAMEGAAPAGAMEGAMPMPVAGSPMAAPAEKAPPEAMPAAEPGPMAEPSLELPPEPGGKAAPNAMPGAMPGAMPAIEPLPEPAAKDMKGY